MVDTWYGQPVGSFGYQTGEHCKKLSAGVMGPVTVEVNRIQIAIGFGMAKRILVAVEDSAS